MAQRTLARLYDTHEAGAEVVRRLEDAGIPHSDISIVARDMTKANAGTPINDAATAHTMETTDSGTAAGTGASIGTILGGGAGLLAGIGALAIPGVGPVVAAGWLIATITGAGVGAAAGGIAGSLAGAGVSHDEAQVYDQGVRRGGTLVTVRVDDTDAARVEEILDAGGPADWRSRGDEYRAGGWTPGIADPAAPVIPDPVTGVPPLSPGLSGRPAGDPMRQAAGEPLSDDPVQDAERRRQIG